MKAASINEIKNELGNLSAAELVDLCVRLAKYKKDNKELLNYLLFESSDEAAYISAVKTEMEEGFAEINTINLYYAKKSIRKILRITNKYIKYTASKPIEIELLLHFCSTLKHSKIPFEKSTALANLYKAQIKKIEKLNATLHEDLQYDYQKALDKL